ncbi:hypothetical protein [Peptostreptococcus equinus]|uniref:Tryptophan-rich sensory protein n=1 Tax=Peptostreptococcus equinus TaxID=3003601 RepID=A0ABY7JN97_9FIRM|nr:hypothetical protein [Peptostreptococcus sp. CBA3647]WAW14570.1 hypothetical protein O0R46_08195 [Peptostreptococcus sp. CBA3647]
MKKKSSSISIILFILTILANYVSAKGLIPNSLSQQVVSGKYPTPITPAGFTFSIWGVIYLFLFVSLIYFLLKSRNSIDYYDSVEKASPLLWIALISNIIWNFVFGMQYIILSVVVIFVYTISLILFTRNISKIENKINEFVKLAFGIHCGWMIVASLVNIYACFYSLDKNIFSNPIIFVIVALALVFFMTILVMKFTNNEYIPLAVIWAFWGIKNNAYLSSSNYSLINILLLLISILLAIYMIKVLLDYKKSRKN